MLFEPSEIAGLWAVYMEPHVDLRGSFARLFCQDEFKAHGLADVFVQVSLSVSPQAGTLRGMHFQRAPYEEAKLVTCVHGAVFDVIVDLRVESDTYLCWRAFDLTQSNNLTLYIPKGCAHGFQTLVDDCVVIYQIDTPHAPDHTGGIRYDDPALHIDWPRAVSKISEKDLNWPLLSPDEQG